MDQQAKRDSMYYLMRRIHSITGILPIGGFLIQHMYGNVLALWGPEVYDHHVNFILEQPLLPLLEWGGIFIPLAIHAILGVLYTINADMNPRQLLAYGYGRNRAYWMQRFTGILALVYIILHVAGTRFSFTEGEKGNMYMSMAAYFQASPWLVWVYCVGVVAASYHLCNGIWSFCIMWGITITRKSQDLVFKGSLGLFVALSAMGIASALQLGGHLGPHEGFGNPAHELAIVGVLDRAEKAIESAEGFLDEEELSEKERAAITTALADVQERSEWLSEAHEFADQTADDLDLAAKELDAELSRLRKAMNTAGAE